MAEYNATWTEYQDAIERVFRYQTTHNNTLPAYVTVKGVNYTKKDYIDAVKRVQAYITKNKKNPPRVWLRKQDTPKPAPTPSDCYKSQRYLKDANIKQDTNYFCACNIFQQIMYELYGIVIKESDITKAMGTTTNGTSHPQIISGGKAIAKRYGHNVSIEFKNFSSMTEKEIGKLIADPNVGIFVHDLYKLTWGHYEYLIGLCLNSGVYTVANSLSGGYIEKRSRATMKSYINGISQPSIGIVRKIS